MADEFSGKGGGHFNHAFKFARSSTPNHLPIIELFPIETFYSFTKIFGQTWPAKFKATWEGMFVKEIQGTLTSRFWNISEVLKIKYLKV